MFFVAMSTVLVVGLLAALVLFVVLPARGCPKMPANAPTGSVSYYCFTPFIGTSHYLGGIADGPDGNLWFTEGSHIGRLTPDGAITEFVLPTNNTASIGQALVAGPDGNLWFTEPSADALGRITPQGVVTEYPLPAGDTFPVGLAVGPDGALWYTRWATRAAEGYLPNTASPGLIGRMSISGTVTEFPLPTPPAPRSPAQPTDIVAGPDGALWFDTGVTNSGESGDSWIGRITTSGQASIVYAPDPQALVFITGLTVGPDHNLWFTQFSNIRTPVGSPGQTIIRIGRLTPSGTLTLFPLPESTNRYVGSGGIVSGPDGTLWFGTGGGQIGRVTTSGQVTMFSLPESSAVVGSMVVGPGMAVWFVQTYSGRDLIGQIIWRTKIGRITV